MNSSAVSRAQCVQLASFSRPLPPRVCSTACVQVFPQMKSDENSKNE